MLKTHTCGELRKEHAGQQVTLAGWVSRRRDQGGLVFINLRDRWGVTQVVVDRDSAPEAHAIIEGVRREYVLQVTGTVRQRPKGQEKAAWATGDIEIEIEETAILNASRTPPIPIGEEEDEPNEAERMKYRYLDLRRPRMQRNIMLRHEAVLFIRQFLAERGFIEIETPILFKSTPEGARDYLVPSRVHPGKFYALPQSPQQLKQLLMVAGYERYFQIARCFRDEDQRGDRQPEFTQLDLEMSFVERDDVLNLIEELMTAMVKTVSDKTIANKPFPRLAYHEALERFGTDRPDVRYGMELVDISDIASRSAFQIFVDNTGAGKPVKAIVAPGAGGYSRQLDELRDFARDEGGAKDIAYFALPEEEEGQVRSPIAKHFAPELQLELFERVGAGPGDLVLISSDEAGIVNATLSALRVEMASRLGLADGSQMSFCWIIDFPLFEWNEDENRWDPSHHMFTSPKPEEAHLLDSDPAAVHSQQYDLVANGYEVAGGSIRIHDRALQEKIFALVGLDVAQAKERFGHMLEAFEFGAPPHGGIAPGIDRLVMLMAGEPNIREVIAFPKSQNAADLMADAPSEVEAEQLKELHIALELDGE
jgi:aspartyl-tRNA synthetase